MNRGVGHVYALAFGNGDVKVGRTRNKAKSCISPKLRVLLENTRFPIGMLPGSKRMTCGGTVPGGMKARARFT